MIAAMLLTTADALMRYLAHMPIQFAFYLTSNYLMICMATMPMAWGFRTGGYIRVNLFTQHLSVAARRLLYRAGLLVGAGYVAVLAHESAGYTYKQFALNRIVVQDFNWPVGWSWIWIPVGCGLLALRVLLTCFGPGETLEADETAHELEHASESQT